MGKNDINSARDAKRARRRQRVARAGRIGRGIVLAIYWSGLVYMLVVGFATVIPQAFFPKIAEKAATEPLSCVQALQSLRGELTRKGAEATHSTNASSIADQVETTFTGWDERFIGLRARCGDAAGYDDLERFRYRYQTTLRRFAREEGAIIERVDRALGTDPS